MPQPNRTWNHGIARRPAKPSGAPTFVAPKDPRPRESWWTTANRDGFTREAWDRRRTDKCGNLLPLMRGKR